MRVSVVLCSYGRPAVLEETVQSILQQTHMPEEILIVTPSLEHVEQRTLGRDRVRLIRSRRGLTIQRNAALDNLGDADLVAFIDDDMELCRTYLANMVRLFTEGPEVIVASGRMLADGGRGEQVSRERARALCAEADMRCEDCTAITTRPLDYAYGCNLIVEDSDFSYHCTRGRMAPVTNLSAQCVHLGWRGGRISGQRMGYSQIINPIYLWKKARVFPLRHIVTQYWMRCLVANCIGVVWGKAEDDRFNRLKGNTLAMWDLVNGRCDPMAINQLR
jgi:glycosyltransferase involved in cell wall biosynthesis